MKKMAKLKREEGVFTTIENSNRAGVFVADDTSAPVALSHRSLEKTERTLSPEEQLKEMTSAMGLFEWFAFNRALSSKRREHAKKLAEKVFEALFESTTYRVALALDYRKKEAFTAYLRTSEDLQKELFRLHAEGSRVLAEELIEVDEKVADFVKKADVVVTDMASTGRLKDQAVEKLRARYGGVAEQLLQSNLENLRMILNQQRELLSRTLHLFMSSLKDRGVI